MLQFEDVTSTVTQTLPPSLPGGEPHHNHASPRHTGPRRALGGEPTPHLTVQFDVLGEGGVDLREGAAQPATGHLDQVQQGVHVVVLHKVLPLVEL